ncbi:MAG: serine/threonine protein phosphatase [Chitinophagales bacterium]|nr:serine/threonine protein phosphatase [Chitinophagales bacterium]
MKRTLVIGDIHGGLRALKQVMERAAVTSEDNLIFLGDLVDGWSESAQVVDFVMECNLQQDCIFIKGNHDEWCEEWLRTGSADSRWLPHGGMETIRSYDGYSKEVKHRHLLFIERMNYFETDEKNRLFIHAGFTSMHGPSAEFHSSNFSWDRTLWEMALTLDKSIPLDSPYYPKRLRLFREIYIGHTPTFYYDRDTPMNGANVWNLDTGAAFKGKLSIMDIDTKEYWQSDRVTDLYPGEQGRNK